MLWHPFSPPFFTQEADLICHQTLLQKGNIWTAGFQLGILWRSQLHDAVDKSQGETQVTQGIQMSLLINKKNTKMTGQM